METKENKNVEEQKKFIVDYLDKKYHDREELENLVENARKRFWLSVRENIKSVTAWAAHEIIEYVMRTLKWNIFIIQDTTRLPVKFTSCDLYKPDRKSIVILNLDNIHFEPICEFEEDKDHKIIQHTTFSFDHPLIQSLYGYLCK